MDRQLNPFPQYPVHILYIYVYLFFYNLCLSFILLLEVRSGKGGTEQVASCTFFCEQVSENYSRTGFFVRQRLTSAIKRVESVSDRMSHILERVCSQTQLCQLRCFNDYTRQLRVSAPTGHLQVVFKRT